MRIPAPRCCSNERDATGTYALNRGVLLTPFHNMALVAPQATVADIDRHTQVFGEMAAEIGAHQS